MRLLTDGVPAAAVNCGSPTGLLACGWCEVVDEQNVLAEDHHHVFDRRGRRDGILRRYRATGVDAVGGADAVELTHCTTDGDASIAANGMGRGFYGTCDWLQIRLRRSAFPVMHVSMFAGDIVRNTAEVSYRKKLGALKHPLIKI